MNLWDIIILGFVEGVSEFFPISSTGHLILTARMLKLPQTDFMKSFEIAIQLGAIISVVVLYWRTLLVDRKTVALTLTAFLPTAVLGAVFYKIIKSFLLNSELLVLITLFLGGIILMIFEHFYREKPGAAQETSDITFRQAFIIGSCQALAMIPGVSRSLATILAGLALGLSRKAVVKFSFLLAVPTMLAATGYDLMKSAASFTSAQFGSLAIGFIIAFVVALASVKFLIRYIEKHNFMAFGVYRVLIAILFLIVLKH